ncbi:MAG: flagellar biosynthetic protein FliO [Bradymonadales bacterium]|nr:flagellar biosynthetic protein FliO [Bradymonadales bacterium]
MRWATIAIGTGELAGQQRMPPTGEFGWMLVRTTIILVVICLLAYLLIRFVLRRFLPAARAGEGRSGRLVPLDRLSLDPRRSLVVVKAGSKVLLIGLGDDRCDLLCELDPLEWADLPPPRRGSLFSRHLDQVVAKGKRSAGPSGRDVIALDQEASGQSDGSDRSRSAEEGESQ